MTEADALSPERIADYSDQLNDDWVLDDDSMPLIRRAFSFANYEETIAFVNQVADVAREQDHHPTMIVEYARCTVEYSTHSASGITLNDLICAARIDALSA